MKNQRSYKTYTQRKKRLNSKIHFIWTQHITNPKLWWFWWCQQISIGEWTVKSLKCVIAKGLPFSVILTFTVTPETKKTINDTHTM